MDATAAVGKAGVVLQVRILVLFICFCSRTPNWSIHSPLCFGAHADCSQLYCVANEIAAPAEAEPKEEAEMSVVAASVALLAVTVVTAVCADYCAHFSYMAYRRQSDFFYSFPCLCGPVVASIEEFAVRYHVPKPFIGLILLPIVANAAEHVTSVWMAMKNQMELTITICVGSSIVRCSCIIVVYQKPPY